MRRVFLIWFGGITVVLFWVGYVLLCFLPCIEALKDLFPLLQERKELFEEAFRLLG